MKTPCRKAIGACAIRVKPISVCDNVGVEVKYTSGMGHISAADVCFIRCFKQPEPPPSNGLFWLVRADRSCLYYDSRVRIYFPCIGNHRDIPSGGHVLRIPTEKLSAYRQQQAFFSFVIPCLVYFDLMIEDDMRDCLLLLVR